MTFDIEEAVPEQSKSGKADKVDQAGIKQGSSWDQAGIKVGSSWHQAVFKVGPNRATDSVETSFSLLSLQLD